MTHIYYMVFLGVLAGMISCFWTRIIRQNMIFRRFGKYIETLNNRHLMKYTCDSMVVKLIRCSFCLQVWVAFLLELFYIITYAPYWIFALIGVFGGLGAGNFVCEIVHVFRNGE